MTKLIDATRNECSVPGSGPPVRSLLIVEDDEPLMRCLLVAASGAVAAEPMAPSDIQATFFNGQPFTASTPGGTQFKMIFTPNGKMSREPLAQSGYKNNGTWKLDAKGFCTSWNQAKA